MNTGHDNASADVAETMRRIYGYGLTSASGGNVSQRDTEGTVWITAAAVDKGLLSKHDVARIDIDGAQLSGPRPSSEWPFHVAIYRARPDLQAIVHAHAPALVAASLLELQLDTRLIPSCYASCGPLGKTAYHVPGSAELAAALASVFSQGHDCALMQNHGIVIGARSLYAARSRLEILEMSARTIFTARELGTLRSPLTRNEPVTRTNEQRAGSDWQPWTHHQSPLATRGTKSQGAADLVNFATRGYQCQLLQNGRGMLSVRCNASPDRFLATPRWCDFYALDAQQLLVQDLSASLAAVDTLRDHPLYHPALYQALYRADADIGAIIHAHPSYASAFSLVQDDQVPVTIPESYIVLGHVRVIDPPFEASNAIQQIVSAIDLQRPALILARDGVMVAGRSLLEAFDRLEVLESTARTIVYARRQGTMVPLAEPQLQELESRRQAHAISKQHVKGDAL